jgi:1,2-phenylacetyl-CoA epoxidase catalytic subunit
VNHGDFWVKKMALDRPTKAGIQAALNLWYPRTMNIFGRPKTTRNQIYKRYGLKRRDNDEVRKAFTDEVRLKCMEWGLDLPDWKPDWKQVEEDGVISG